MILKRSLTVLIALIMLIFAFSACKSEGNGEKPDPEPEQVTLSVEDLDIQHETEFGGVYIKITIEDFNKLGFEYGDSVSVRFSNGYTLEDIPYYNGYYVDAGQPLLVAYPGYDYIKACVNYGADMWDTADLDDTESPNLLKSNALRNDMWVTAQLEPKEEGKHYTAAVYLNEHGKYLDIQQARDIHYYDERERYPSDEVFANFREITVGIIKSGILYRSASPCDNQHNRATYVDRLIEGANVNCILNLADNERKIERYNSDESFECPYFLSLYSNGKVIPVALSMNYLSDDFAVKIADGFIKMSEMDGPYLIHCTEGKDRTGFVCMLIEALAGASYQEIADDYMLTYANYYEITKESEPSKYTTILEKNLDAMLITVVGDDSVDIKTADLSVYARNYLLNAGMTEEQIDTLVSRITE